MRALLLSLGLVGAVLVVDTAPASAQGYPIYPWCAQYGGDRGGGANCYFSNLWQCQQAISGNGGFCYENPFAWGRGPGPAGPPATARKSKRRAR